ncbi:MAG: methionine adenosyltransferase [Deltaproteobacteria bacterium]|nr:methionine adenosyltransferase [Deltaproteobacteria bacterium]
MNSKKLFVAESATCGQPDKLCDLIVETILDRVLEDDRFARVDLDAMAAPGLLLVAGQLTTKAYLNIQGLVRDVVDGIGYNTCATNFEATSIAILTMIGEQSPEIHVVVDNKGAGNQGMGVGYATDEGRAVGVDLDFMPLPQWLAHRLTAALDRLRLDGKLPHLYADGTSQIVVQYDEGVPTRLRSAVLSAHHRSDAALEDVRRALRELVLDPILGDFPEQLTSGAEVLANPAGPFTVGGPAADIGLSGRKGVSDAYGTACAFGGSSPVGKDPTKTDRASVCMARYLAKNLVAAGIARRAEIRLVYLLGRRDPLSVQVDTFGTSSVDEPAIAQALAQLVDLSTPGMVEHLQLRKVRYAPTACGGTYGRPELDLPWERLDLVDALRSALG